MMTSIAAERDQKSEVVDYLLWQWRRHRQHAGDLIYEEKSAFSTTVCRCTRWCCLTTRSTHEFLASPAFSPGSTSTAGETPPSTRRLPRPSTQHLQKSPSIQHRPILPSFLNEINLVRDLEKENCSQYDFPCLMTSQWQNICFYTSLAKKRYKEVITGSGFRWM